VSYIKDNKEFILGVVAYGNKPDMSNKIAANIIAEYEEITGIKVNRKQCFTCGKNNVFDKIYLYAKASNIW
jgi:hypothetical protein